MKSEIVKSVVTSVDLKYKKYYGLIEGTNISFPIRSSKEINDRLKKGIRTYFLWKKKPKK